MSEERQPRKKLISLNKGISYDDYDEQAAVQVYLDKKIQEAYQRSLAHNTDLMKYPTVKATNDDIEDFKFLLERLKTFYDASNNEKDKAQMREQMNYYLKQLTEKQKYLLNCIYEATGFYDENNRAMSNYEFSQNPGKYGFTEIGRDELKQGDLVQYLANGKKPEHMMVYNRTDDQGKIRTNYSNGSSAYRKDARYDPNNESYRYYRYTGTEDDINKAKRDYREDYWKLKNQEYLNNNKYIDTYAYDISDISIPDMMHSISTELPKKRNFLQRIFGK